MMFVPAWLFWLVFSFACLGLLYLFLMFLMLLLFIWLNRQFEQEHPDLPRLKKRYQKIDANYRS